MAARLLPRMELIAEVKPPTNFTREPRSVKLALNKRALGRYSERTPLSAGVCTQDSGCTTFHMVRNGKWK